MNDKQEIEEEKDQAFEDLLEFIKQSRGFDFTGYKRASLKRQMQKRLGDLQCKSFSSYIDYLEMHHEEFTELFNTLLINVTGFFRNPLAWKSLQENFFPLLQETKLDNAPIRVWSAACASGEETYTIAMLLGEAIGLNSFADRVKIYATDLDEQALAHARQGSYSAQQMEDVPEALREKYFESSNGRFTFRADLRRAIIFGRHNLVHDASISRLDLLICRNTLMYFNSELQSRILTRFHFGLNTPGYLFLGKAEMLVGQSDLFRPVDLKHRLFEKIPKNNLRERLLMLTQSGRNEPVHGPIGDRLLPVAFDTQPEAQFVVDRKGILMLAGAKARAQFNISVRDIGRPLHDLEVSYRPVDLRTMIDQAFQKGEPIAMMQVERNRPNGAVEYFDVKVVPLSENGKALGASVTFHEVTIYHQLHARLKETNEALETASEELHSTNEELETTNEELQSTVEELETTNEELQSANEEMETMNEELQAANQEMEAINTELHQRSDDYNQSQAFLQSILTGLKAGVIVLDSELQVINWNRGSEDLWGLRADEVQGQPALSLDIGLPINSLMTVIRECLSGESQFRETVVEATSRRGKIITCNVMCTPLRTLKGDIEGVILLADAEHAREHR